MRGVRVEEAMGSKLAMGAEVRINLCTLQRVTPCFASTGIEDVILSNNTLVEFHRKFSINVNQAYRLIKGSTTN